LTKFIYSFLIGISLLLIPQLAYADEVLIELTPEIAYVDTVVEVTTPTEYVIETTTGPRFEIAPSGINTERVAWVDSWIQLRQGEVVLRQDDDSNHNPQTNYYASKLTGTLDTGSYTIRATSYNYIVAGQRPIGTYTLSSNLINLPEVEPAPIPEPEPLPSPEPAPVAPPIIIDYQPVAPTPPPEPPIVAPEPPDIVYIPPLVEPEPPAEVEEPPAEAEEPPVEAEEPPVEAEEPPDVEEEAPVPVEEPPVEAEEPPAEEEAPPVEEVVQASEVELETLAPETPVQLDNGVVLEAGTVVALQLLENPAELISAIFDNPAEVLTALSNIGADMSEEERTASENTIIASVIAGQAAINAVSAATASAARTSTPTPSSGGSAPSVNDNIKLYKRRKP
jgi:hypothetical protein